MHKEIQCFQALLRGFGLARVLRVDAQDGQWCAQFVGRVSDEASLAFKHTLDLGQQAVERVLHGLQLSGQGRYSKRFEAFGIALADDSGHRLQRAQAPADGQPDRHHQQRHTDQRRPQRVTDNALNQVLAHVIALTHPNEKTLLWIGEEKAAPLVAVLDQIMGAFGCRRCTEQRRFGRAHQQLARGSPDLKGQPGFVGMGHATGADPAHGLIERLIQLVEVLFTRCALMQHALQQARALGQLCVVDFFDFVMAVAQGEQADGQVAEQQQHQHRDQNARAYRGHALSSSR